MQHKKTKKNNSLKILLSLIVGYILIVCGIVLYENFTSSSHSEIVVNQSSPTAAHGVQSEIMGDAVIFDEQALDEMSDEEFEKAYQKHLVYSLADVPARTLGEQEDVFVAVNTPQAEAPKGFFEKIGDMVSSLFGESADQPKKETDNAKSNISQSQSIEMLYEIDGEIQEMQSNFAMYKESSGVTYIDHINKPSRLESNGFYIYIGVAPNGFTFHRTIIRYSGEDEIDLQRILIQTSVTDKASIIDAAEGLLQHRVTTAVNEWVDLPPTEENNTLLNSIVASDEVKVTFMGSIRNVEWVLNEDDLVTLRESLHFYNLLKGKEELSK